MEFARLARSNEKNLDELWTDFVLQKQTTVKKRLPIENVVTMVCEAYGVGEHYFYSKMKFNGLPQARRVTVFILLKLGYKSIDLQEYFGWSQPRVAALKRTATQQYNNNETFQISADHIYETITG